MSDENQNKAAGGHARAQSLSPQARTEIAKRAAAERWRTDIPKATHAGLIYIGEAEIQCYVLDTGDRVISTRGMMKALGRRWRGRKYTGTELPVFAEANNLKPFIDNNLRAVLSPLEIRTDKGAKSQAFKAEVLPGVCRLYLAARRANALTQPQLRVADQCEILQNGLSELGILGLVDEATGYQYVRERDALQRILDKYLQDHAKRWSKTFPDEFWHKLIAVKGFPSYIALQRPAYVGHWVNDIVYDRLLPGIRKKLKELNPRTEAGHRKARHHQFLTEDHGVPELKEHLVRVMALMDASSSKAEFERLLNRAVPKHGDSLLLPFPDDEFRQPDAP